MNLYTYEIWTSGGTKLADLGAHPRNRIIKVGRNRIEEMTFDIDTDALKQIADAINSTPAGVLGVGTNELRIRRNDTYLVGGRIDFARTTVDRDNAYVQVVAHGFLSMFADRYLEAVRTFTGVDYATVLWTIINESQSAGTDWDFGITQGTLNTIGNITIEYAVDKNIKDLMIEATENQALPMDIEFTPDKVFNAWSRRGSDKPGLIFEYPGNVVSGDFTIDAQLIANRIITSGGNGARSIDEDASSESNYKVRQKLLQANQEESVTNLSNLGKGYYAAAKDPLDLPNPMVDLNGNISIEDFWVGDRITFRQNDPSIPSVADGLFRVEYIFLTIDSEDSETALLTLAK